jgi:phytoene synthase
MLNALSYIGLETRRQDPDRFLCSLFASEKKREGLYAVLAFNTEIAKSREVVNEALLGEIRLQWWRDTIGHIYNNLDHEVKDHVVATELSKTIKKYSLSRDLFKELIDARSRDMIDEPPFDEAEFRAYAIGTSAVLSRLMIEILSPSNVCVSANMHKATEHVGVAWAFTGILRASAILAKYKRVCIPQSLMQSCGFGIDEYLAQKITPEIQKATAYIVGSARLEIEQARGLLNGKIEQRYRPVFLQASLAEMYLNKIELLGFNPFAPRLEIGRAWRQLKITYIASRGSF